MVNVFSSNLDRSLTSRSISPGTLQYIQSNETKLAGLDLPSDIEADTKMVVRAYISRAFVFGFRIVMMVCVGLSLASALVAWLMIPAKSG
jgi:hypothetical protein